MIDGASVVDEATCVAASGLQVTFRRDHPLAWDEAISALAYVPVAFSPAWIDYQLTYQRGHGGVWRDLSMVLLHDHRPCGAWPLSVSSFPRGSEISSHGLPVLAPLFAPSLSQRARKAVVQQCLNILAALSLSTGYPVATSAESFVGDCASGVSDWHIQSMRRGARAVLRHELFVDLTLPMDGIRSRFRKSYRALINSGGRLWRVIDMVAADFNRWSEFRELHARVAGRVTRSAESWELQHQAIVDGNAFLVYLLDEQERMVGGGYFGNTRDEGVYEVGAYDRTLFDKPLGHVVQYRAIELLKARGVRWYKIGMRPFEGDLPQPDGKELSIAEFKQGFATHLFPRYVLDHEFKNTEPR